MRIVFFGSGNFAVTILKGLCESGHQIPLVVTQPDKRQGRHLHIEGTPVKNYAVSRNLEIYQPDNINTDESFNILKNTDADIFIVVSYGKILSEKILEIPKIFSINIHASLLPKYRGAAPIQRALIAGEKETGVTFIKMNEKMDEGDILFQCSLKIGENDTSVSLDEKLAMLSCDCLSQVFAKLQQKTLKPFPQDRNKATRAPIIKKEDGLIDWNKSSDAIFNQYRGCFGWPGTYTYLNGKRIKITDMKKGKDAPSGTPGAIIGLTSDSIEVACAIGTILIAEVLPESHKKMPIRSFLTGHKLAIGTVFASQ